MIHLFIITTNYFSLILIGILLLTKLRYNGSAWSVPPKYPEKSHSGLVRGPGKLVYRKVSGVRIPPSPPKYVKLILVIVKIVTYSLLAIIVIILLGYFVIAFYSYLSYKFAKPVNCMPRPIIVIDGKSMERQRPFDFQEWLFGTRCISY